MTRNVRIASVFGATLAVLGIASYVADHKSTVSARSEEHTSELQSH